MSGGGGGSIRTYSYSAKMNLAEVVRRSAAAPDRTAVGSRRTYSEPPGRPRRTGTATPGAYQTNIRRPVQQAADLQAVLTGRMEPAQPGQLGSLASQPGQRRVAYTSSRVSRPPAASIRSTVSSGDMMQTAVLSQQEKIKQRMLQMGAYSPDGRHIACRTVHTDTQDCPADENEPVPADSGLQYAVETFVPVVPDVVLESTVSVQQEKIRRQLASMRGGGAADLPKRKPRRTTEIKQSEEQSNQPTPEREWEPEREREPEREPELEPERELEREPEPERLPSWPASGPTLVAMRGGKDAPKRKARRDTGSNRQGTQPIVARTQSALNLPAAEDLAPMSKASPTQPASDGDLNGTENDQLIRTESDGAVGGVDPPRAAGETATELCSKLFDAIDRDESGFLEAQEGKLFLSRTGCPASEVGYYWKDVLRVADKNKDGQKRFFILCRRFLVCSTF